MRRVATHSRGQAGMGWSRGVAMPRCASTTRVDAHTQEGDRGAVGLSGCAQRPVDFVTVVSPPRARLLT